MKTIQKEARFLSKGDKLGNGAIVTSNPWIGIDTPKGKVHINIQYPNEKEGGFTRTWGKYTKIGVLPQTETADVPRGT